MWEWTIHILLIILYSQGYQRLNLIFSFVFINYEWHAQWRTCADPNLCGWFLLFTLADNIELETSRLHRGIMKVDKWLRDQGFQLDTGKSVYIIITRKRVSILPPLYIGDSVLINVTKHKFLGFIFWWSSFKLDSSYQLFKNML